MEDGKIRLGEDRKEELNTILSLIDKYRIETDTDSRNYLIKMIAQRHIITKGMINGHTRTMLCQDELDWVLEIDKKIRDILYPIYSQLTDMAVNHMEQWFFSLQRKRGVLNPKMYKYQKRLARFLLKACIYADRPDLIYTLLISRGGSKTYTMSMVGSFLMIFHNRYIIHNINNSYFIGCIAPYTQQLISFQKYYHEFIELSMTTDEEIGLVGRNEKDENLLGLYTKYNSTGRIEIVQSNGASFSGVYLRVGSESIEGIHLDLLEVDEFKMFGTNRRVIYSSLMPTLGARNGIFLAMSSASHEYCLFQELCSKNADDDFDDYENGNIDLKYETRDGRNFEKGRFDNVKIWEGLRMFIQHYSQMVMDGNDAYSITISRMLHEGMTDEFLTQYDNKFLSNKTSDFFDIKNLRENHRNIFEDDNIQKYMDNPKYVLIGGLDCAVTGDNSILTIKALDSGFGENRKTKIITQYMLNPSKNKNTEHVLNQAKSVVEIIKNYKLKSLVIDESGVGKGMSNYIKDILREEFSFIIDPKNIIGVVITSGNRTQLLDYYYNRIQSGMEKFFHIPKEWEDEDHLKKLYVNSLKLSSEDAMKIMMIYEHSKFVRSVIKDDETGAVKITYTQAKLNYIHDDFIWSSCLTSYILSLNPTITGYYEKPEINFNNGIYNRNF